MDERPAPAGYGALFRTPAYVRVFAAGIGSVGGSAIASVCLVWFVYARTGSAFAIALLGISGLAASIAFSVFGGAWVDRADRRRLMILADFVRAGAVALLVLDLELRGFDFPGVLAVNFVVGAFTVVFNPAEQALVPSLVPAAHVADANGLVRSSRSVAQFVGAAVAGALIVAVGPIVGIAVNAVTFAVSGSLLLGIRSAPPAPRPRAGHRAYLADIAAGFRWLYRATGLFQLTLSATIFNFCASVVGTFLVVYATEVLHGSALVFAGLLAAEVAGAAGGALLVGRTGAARHAGRVWVLAYGVASGAVTVALVELPTPAVALAVLFALGLLGGFAGTAWLTAAQLAVPREMQGRYFGIDNLGSVAIIPVAQIGGALLIADWGVRSAYLAAGILWFLAGLAFLAPRALAAVGAPSPASRRTDGAAPGTPGSPAESRGG
ncbi:MAG TPA: MFS transporter [Thermoplasmata archaeon]|nr:MFS transporter [Thermoplasmata archaeon]